jgi:hypothetical protein
VWVLSEHDLAKARGVPNHIDPKPKGHTLQAWQLDLNEGRDMVVGWVQVTGSLSVTHTCTHEYPYL